MSILSSMRIRIIISILGIVLFSACIKSFIPNFSSPKTGYLVVEGWINSGVGSTSILLSRSTQLNDTLVPPPELGAMVIVEGINGNLFSLTDQGNGTYYNAQLGLDHGTQYRLHIKTSDGNDYYSDYQYPIKSAPLDSLGWVKNKDGVTINLFGHGSDSPQNYHIEYTQTYEIVSAAFSKFVYLPITDTIIARDPSQILSLYNCWNTLASDSILIASTTSLNAPYALFYKLVHIPIGTIPLGVEYSIEAEEHAMSNTAYTFFQGLKSSSEPSSSLFNALPGQAQGNIHNSKNANETVIGYVGFADIYKKRIFINNSQVFPWNYNPSCPTKDLVYAPEGSKYDLKTRAANRDTFSLYDLVDSTSKPHQFIAGPIPCLDCQTYGSPVKPSFWPN